MSVTVYRHEGIPPFVSVRLSCSSSSFFMCFIFWVSDWVLGGVLIYNSNVIFVFRGKGAVCFYDC